MPFEILRPEHETTSVVVATERLWLTADGRLVADGDPEAESLYCIPGNRIPLVEAQRVGLAEGGPAPEKVEASADTEKVEAAGLRSPWDDMNVKQLRALAAERGVDVTGLKKRDELLEALLAAEATADTGEGGSEPGDEGEAEKVEASADTENDASA